MLSGTGRPGDEILLWQGEKINRLSGETEENIKANADLQKLMFGIVKSELEGEELKAIIRNAVGDWIESQTPEIKAAYDTLDPAYQEMQLAQITLPWMRCFLKYDPCHDLENIKCPVLAMCGTKDVQVDAETDLDEIEKALEKGGNKNYKIVKLEDLNHLFQHCETGLVTEYGQIEETFAPKALKIIDDWLDEIVIK